MTSEEQRRIDEQDEQVAQQALYEGPRALSKLCNGALLACIRSPELRQWADTYATEDGGKLIIGPTSIGKTSAVVWAVKRVVKLSRAEFRKNAEAVGVPGPIGKGLSVCWTRAVELASARLQHGLGEGEAPMIRKAEDARLLVIDDLGWETRSDTLEAVLACRYDRGLPTLVTSGKTAGELVERYGQAFLRRIVESRGEWGAVLDLFPKIPVA